MSPTALELGPGARASLRVAFAPPAVGLYRGGFYLVCDNCQVQAFKLTGLGTFMDVPALVALDGEPPRSAVLAEPLWFGEQVPGATNVRTIVLRNRTGLPYPFRWGQNRATRSAVAEGAAASEPTSPEASGFSIEPAQGVLQPGEELLFTIFFTPAQCGHTLVYARMACDKSAPGYVANESTALPDDLALELGLEGLGVVFAVEAQPPQLVLPEALLPGEAAAQPLQLANGSDADAKFSFEGACCIACLLACLLLGFAS